MGAGYPSMSFTMSKCQNLLKRHKALQTNLPQMKGLSETFIYRNEAIWSF
jgi:hypothetical protein